MRRRSFDQALVDRDVLVDHALRAEPRDPRSRTRRRSSANTAPARLHRVFEIAEHMPVTPSSTTSRTGAAVERRHRRAAGHRFGEHQPERLAA